MDGVDTGVLTISYLNCDYKAPQPEKPVKKPTSGGGSSSGSDAGAQSNAQAKLTQAKSPQTGDNSHVILWQALAAGAAGALAIVGWVRKRKNI